MAKAKPHNLVHLLIGIILLTLIVSLLTVIAVVINNKFEINGGITKSGHDIDRPLPVHISKSYPVCDKEIYDKFGNSVAAKTYDELSNRYDRKRGLHLLYAKVDIQHDKDIEHLLVICEIYANSNRIRDFKTEPLD